MEVVEVAVVEVAVAAAATHLAAVQARRRLLQPLGLAGGELGHHAGAAARHLRRLRQLARQLLRDEHDVHRLGLAPLLLVYRERHRVAVVQPDARRQAALVHEDVGALGAAQEAEVARPVGDGAREHLRRGRADLGSAVRIFITGCGRCGIGELGGGGVGARWTNAHLSRQPRRVD